MTRTNHNTRLVVPSPHLLDGQGSLSLENGWQLVFPSVDRQSMSEPPGFSTRMARSRRESRIGAATLKEYNSKNHPSIRSKQGRFLLDFCVKSGLSIMNTLFEHQSTHTYTWHKAGSMATQSSFIDFKVATDHSWPSASYLSPRTTNYMKEGRRRPHPHPPPPTRRICCSFIETFSRVFVG